MTRKLKGTLTLSPAAEPTENNTLFVDNITNDLKWKDNSGNTKKAVYSFDDETFVIHNDIVYLKTDYLAGKIPVITASSGDTPYCDNPENITDGDIDTFARIDSDLKSSTPYAYTYLTYTLEKERDIYFYSYTRNYIDAGYGTDSLKLEFLDGSDTVVLEITDTEEQGKITNSESYTTPLKVKTVRISYTEGIHDSPYAEIYDLQLRNY